MCGGISYAQIAAWDFFNEPATPATSTAEVYNTHMDASAALTRGPGAVASAGANSFRTTGFMNNGISTANTDYFQFTLSASTGYTLSLSSINADMRGTATFAATPGVSNQFAYSLDGTTFTLIGTPSVVVGDAQGIASLPQINLSGIAALQNVAEGVTVTFRMYASGQTNTGGWGYYSASAGDYGLSVGGTLNPTTIPCESPVVGPTASPVSVCNGAVATLSATGVINGSTLSWYNVATGGVALQTGATYTTGALTSGTSYWVEEATAGCPAGPRTEVVITVNALPTVNAGVDQTVCSGANVTLSGSGASTYSWNNSVNNGVAFPATATTTYTVTGTDLNGCTGTDDVTITVSGTAPTANAGQDQTVCAGTSVSLTATGTGTFSWDNGVQQAAPFTATATTTYTVTVDNGTCTNTDQVTIFVDQPSVAGTASVSDLDACLNDPLTGTVTGQTGTVEWFVQAPGFPVYNSAGTGASLTIATVPLAGTYNVKAQVTSGACPMVTTNIVTVVVNPLPAVNAGIDQSICAGNSATLTASGAVNYTWNNGVTNGIAFTPTGTATYTVTGTDTHGCMNTDNVVVTVTPLPTVNAGVDQTVCEGGSVTLNATGATTYSWNNGVTNGTAFTPTATMTYTVTGATNGCTNTDQVTVTVNPGPVASATLSGNTITATPAGMSYQWLNCTTSQPIAGATSATYTPTVNGSYAVEVTSGGCTATSACINVTTLGLEDVKADLNLTLYPNPTKGKVTISMPTTDRVNVTVYNALGKVVTTMTNAQNGSVIDLSTAQAGVYMVQVSGDKGAAIYRIVRN